MKYGGPGFPAVVGFGSLPTPSPPFSCRRSSTDGRVGGGLGAKLYYREEASSSYNSFNTLWTGAWSWRWGKLVICNFVFSHLKDVDTRLMVGGRGRYLWCFETAWSSCCSNEKHLLRKKSIIDSSKTDHFNLKALFDHQYIIQAEGSCVNPIYLNNICNVDNK